MTVDGTTYPLGVPTEIDDDVFARISADEGLLAEGHRFVVVEGDVPAPIISSEVHDVAAPPAISSQSVGQTQAAALAAEQKPSEADDKDQMEGSSKS